MAKWGKMDFKALEKISKNFDEAVAENLGEQLAMDILLELANKALAKTKRRTPVGQYTDGTVGGTLRKGWYITSVVKKRKILQVTLYNNVEYASFVEYGHRKRNNKGWVEGRFMVTLSINEVEREMQKVGDKHCRKALQKLLKGD